jgi:hypothetical protein
MALFPVSLSVLVGHGCAPDGDAGWRPRVVPIGTTEGSYPAARASAIAFFSSS